VNRLAAWWSNRPLWQKIGLVAVAVLVAVSPFVSEPSDDDLDSAGPTSAPVNTEPPPTASTSTTSSEPSETTPPTTIPRSTSTSLASVTTTTAPTTSEATTTTTTDVPEGSLVVNAEDFGEDWPLTVESGLLVCEVPGAVIFVGGGDAYAVNGLAETWGYVGIEPIWIETGDGFRKNIGPLIDLGLTLCEQ